jgi:hypothetical protein
MYTISMLKLTLFVILSQFGLIEKCSKNFLFANILVGYKKFAAFFNLSLLTQYIRLGLSEYLFYMVR